MSYIDDDYDYQDNNETISSRPAGLITLCILTFINNIIGFISYMTVFLLYHQLPDIFEQAKNSLPSLFPIDYSQVADIYTSIPQYVYLVLACTAILVLVGAGAMMKMRRIGFHLYVASQLVLLILPAILSQSMNINLLSVLLTMIFIGLYAMYYKKME
ncbi:MAG: hypothetical protein J5701_08155 [Bacteroidales bacterium]|nr:hypothetical protein [Bacteroidales bacterium]